MRFFYALLITCGFCFANPVILRAQSCYEGNGNGCGNNGCNNNNCSGGSSCNALNCQGKTYTQGAWGASNTNPAATYLTSNFSTVFPNGITIGCGSRKLVFTSASAVQAFLPSGTSPAILPTGTLTNPGSTYGNVLAAQILALTLNAYFDANNSNFSSSPSSLLNFSITSGTYQGMSVAAFLNIANQVIGGCSNAYSYSSLNNAATNINENYDNGNSDEDFLVCGPPCSLTVTATSGTIACNGGSTTINIAVTGGSTPYTGTGTFTRSAGTYTFNVASANGCTATAVKTLTQPAVLSAAGLSGIISCYGGTSTINVSASGGTSPYTGTGIFTRSSGPYSYTVTDAKSCKAYVTGTLTQPTLLQASPSNGTISCYGGTSTVNISATGGTSPYTGTGIFTKSAGPYSYTVTDAKGCKAYVTGTLTQPAQLVASKSTGTINCYGGNTTVSVSATGGTSPYTGIGTFTRTAGAYSYTVVDTRGCTAVTSGTLTQPTQIVLSPTNESINCYGGTTTLNITASGGTSPYTGTGTFTRSAGAYSYTVSDNKACTAIVSGTLIQPTQLLASNSKGNISCFGGSTSVSVSATGGTSPYTGIGSFTRTAGAYSYTVTDANGCAAITTGTLTQPSQIVASNSPSIINCFGGSTSVSVSATGGTSPYTGTGSFTRTAGAYSYTVTDANGCSAITTGNISQPNQLVASNSPSTINCFGGSTSVSVSATGGTSPYTGTGSFTRTAGAYSYTVTDANGCFAITTGNISQPSQLIASNSPSTINCFGGSTGVSVSATGGASPYTGTGSFTRTAGAYSYTVTDANGCSAITTGNISQPNQLVASNSPSTINCFGGSSSVSVSATGGASPYTGTGSFTRTAGAYSYTVTDANGCSAITTGNISQPNQLVASNSPSTINCFGGSSSVSVSATGGTSPYTGTGSFTRTAGAYSYTVTDANGCSAITTGTLSQPSQIVASNSPSTINCFGGSTSVSVSATGGTSPYTGTGSFTRTAGAYSYTVTDANGCSAITTGNISQPNQLVASNSPSTINCFGGSTSVSVSATGGTSPYTGTGSFTRTAGAYSYTVTDANGCFAITTGNISQPSQLIASNSPSTINCFGGSTSVSVSATGGTSPYTGTGSFTRTAGAYSYTVTDANGCSAITTGNISQPNQLVASNSPSTINCFGGSTTVSVTATGGTSPYSGTGSFTRTAGAYSYTVTDANGCFAITTGNISQPNQLVASNSPSTINCFGGSTTVSVSATGGTSPYTGTGSFTRTAGAYSYTVTDANGCSAITTGTLTQPSQIVASNSPSTINCFGGSTSVSVSATGGTSPYTGTGSFTRTAGAYSYTVTDANGCSAITTGNISQPNQLVASNSPSTINCFGGSTTVSVTATGGTSPYTGTGSFTRTAGAYSYTVTDANGCSAITTGNISQPNQLVASNTPSTINCFGGSTTVSVAATGGTSPYTGTGSFTRTAGAYSYTVTDANGCAAITTGTLTQPSQIVASNSPSIINCFGGSTSVSVSATGGTSPYTGTGSFTRTAGAYSYTVTDANGCSAITTGNISQPNQLVASNSPSTINCFGGSTAVSVSATGGTSPYTGTGSFTRTAGAYSYTVTDANGCFAITAGTLAQPSQIVASNSPSTINCFGGSTSVSVTATGGTSPYTGTGSFTRTAGAYSYTVTDANGCSAITTGNISQPNQLVASNSPSTINCFGGSTSVSVSATGGTSPYTGTGSFTRTAGAYSYTVTDANGCSAITTGNISQPNQFVASNSPNTINCFGGSTTVSVSATGGTSPYTGTGSFTRTAGAYSYTVTDANGCFAITTGNISQPSQIVASNSPGSINCFGGSTSVSVSATGGTSPYTGTGSFARTAGAYSYTVTDANSCFAITTGTISQPSQIVASNSPSTINCFGGSTSVSFSATGGTSPYTGTGSFTRTAGAYSYTVTDANGCSAITTGTLSQPSQLVASNNPGTINCFGGSSTVSVTATGGTSPYFGTGSFTRTAGAYSYTVTDANGCSAITTGTLTQPSQIVASNSPSTINCFGGSTSVSVSATGGTSPYTGTGSFTRTAGAYSYTVTDANGCSAITTGTLTQPSQIVASNSPSTINCFGGSTSVSVSATGGTSPYTGTGSFTRTAGAYSYTVTDANGCSAITTGNISQPNQLVASNSPSTINCFGGSTTVSVSATGGTSPYTGTGSFTRTAGAYSYTVTDANGCSAITTGNISQPSQLIASNSPSTINCFGGSTGVSVSATGGTAPYTGTGSFTRTAGAYSYTVTDANGCSAITTGNISQPNQLVASNSPSTINCFGGSTSVSVTATGGTSPYTGTGSFTRTAGAYSYTVTDANGCSAITTGTISQPSQIVASNNPGVINCFGGSTSVSVTATGGTSPYTGTGSFTNSAGAYSYTVTDANGCFAITTGTLVQPSQIVASNSTGSINCFGGSTTVTVTATGGTSPYTGSGSFTRTAGAYSYTVTDANGCFAITAGTLAQPLQIVASNSPSTINCFGGSTSVSISATGGTSPYTGTGSFTRTAGAYSYTVTDANGCFAITTGNISQPSQIVASNSTGSINCFGGSTSVSVSATGGTSPYSGTGSFTRTAGAYSYTVTDANGCSAITTGNISQPNQLVASNNPGTINCFGGSSSVSVSATGGTSPYTGTGSFTRTAGAYSYTVTDANGCSAITTGTISQPSQIVASNNPGVINCFGGSTSVSVTATGGTSPYTGTGSFTNSAGAYSYTVTDANGCFAITTGTLVQPSQIVASNSTGSINCFGGSTTVTVTATGGTSPYTGSGSFTRTAGAYSYTVTDANGCFAITAGTLAQPLQIVASNSPSTINCFGGSTSVSISATGGTSPYTGTGSFTRTAGAYSYTVTDANGCFAITAGTLAQPSQIIASNNPGVINCFGGSTSVSFSATGGTSPYTGTGSFTRTAGAYSYTVTDANGCFAITAGTLAQPSQIVTSNNPGTINCFGGSTSVSVSATGGTSPYTGTGSFTNSAGAYSYTVTDANGCSAITTGNISQPNQLVASNSPSTINCFGGSTSVSVSATGGTSPYTGTGSFTRTAGAYSYTVTDANGCFAITTGNISQPSQLIASNSPSTINCFGGSTSVSVSATGGTSPYTGTGSFTRTAGAYSYTVTDANGCFAITTGTLTQPSQLVASNSPSTINCFGGSTTVSVTATGGTSPYTGTGSFTRTAGAYSYTVTDANGCSAISTGNISQPNQLVASNSPSTINCFGGSTTVSVSATGGTSPYTGTGSFTRTAGAYSYTVTDANGCSAITTGNISQPNQLVASNTPSTINCFGGSTTVSVSATGGTSPYTGTGSFTRTAGAYSYTVTDANGCSAITTGTISQPNQLVASNSPSTINCFGDSTSVSVSATGGYSPYTGTGSFTRTAGAYSYTVTDANGCSAITTGTLTQPSALTASYTSGSINCYGGTTTVNISMGGGTAPYTNAGIHVVGAGNFSFTISDNNGCNLIVTGTLSQPPAMQTTLSTGTIACNGGTTTIVVSASGGLSPYTGTGTFTATGGLKTFTVTDANNCSVTPTINVAQPSPLVLNFVTDSIACFGGTTNATLTPTGGTAPYSGNIGTYPIGSGSALFFVTDTNGCQASANVTIGEPMSLTVTLISDSILCNGGPTSATITGMGGTAPYTGAGTFTIAAGIQSYTLTDANGCIAIAELGIGEPTPFVIKTRGHIRCHLDSACIVVGATGGTTPYSGMGTYTLGPGTYSYNVVDSNGCTSSTVITLTDPPQLTVNYTLISPILCFGDSAVAVVTATGGLAPYFGDRTYTIAAGTYTYGVVDSLLCFDTAVAIITQPPPLVASAVMGVIPCLNSETTVSVTATGGTMPYTGVTVYTVPAGSYTYSVIDDNGCISDVVMDVDTSTCLGFENLSFDQIKSTLLYPNPNNGKFYIMSTYKCKAMIVDQNGLLVKEIVLDGESQVVIDELSRGLYFLITPKERIKIAVIYDRGSTD